MGGPIASRESDCLVDLEIGRVTCNEKGSRDPILSGKHGKESICKTWSGVLYSDGSLRGESKLCSCTSQSKRDISENLEVFEDQTKERMLSFMDKQKRKKTNLKKPPKPPRPPRGLPLDAADMKLVREISELAMLKRTRIERMKALKRLKADKARSSSNNIYAMVITILFFVIIIFQGDVFTLLVFSESKHP